MQTDSSGKGADQRWKLLLEDQPVQRSRIGSDARASTRGKGPKPSTSIRCRYGRAYIDALYGAGGCTGRMFLLAFVLPIRMRDWLVRL
jgi:hypothetical protein